jgi:hypothetical protein
MSKNKAQRFPSMREFHKALVEAAAADPWPPVPVNPTLVEPSGKVKAAGTVPREPTAILPGKSTTLSKAAGPVTVEPAERERRRRWLLPALLIVAVAGVGITVAFFLPHGARPAPNPASAPVAQQPDPVPTPPPTLVPPTSDARIVVPIPAAAAPQLPPTAKPSQPPTQESPSSPSRKPAGRKKPKAGSGEKTQGEEKIRNEDL